MAIFTRTIAAGATETFQGVATFVRIMEGSTTMDATIYPWADPLNPGSGDSTPVEIELELGVAYNAPIPFSRIDLVNNSGAPSTVRLVTANGVILDNRLVGTVNITGGITNKGASSIIYQSTTLVGGAAAASICAANTSGREILILPSAANDLFVGEAGVTAANGIPIAAISAPTVLSFNGALFGFSAAGLTVQTWDLVNT